MARKLPVYILCDTSSSMNGEPIESVNNGVEMLANALRKEPQALETVHISEITFDDDAKVVIPLTTLLQFKHKQLTATGITSLGAGLSLVSKMIDQEVQKGSKEKRGDWRPMLFIFTDGGPTDDWLSGLKDLKNANLAVTICCGAGTGCRDDVLKQISDNVVKLSTTNEKDIKTFFKWVTDSITSASKSVGSGKNVSGLSDLPPPPPELKIM